MQLALARPDLLFVTYSAYLVLSIGLTYWVARTLSKNGRIFLVDSFRSEELADSINHLLVVGFYLINLGFVSFYLKTDARPGTSAQALETLSAKMGIVLLVLGGMHFMNIFVFHRMGSTRRAQALFAGPMSPTSPLPPSMRKGPNPPAGASAAQPD